MADFMSWNRAILARLAAELSAENDRLAAERDAYREVAETLHMRFVGAGRGAAVEYVADMVTQKEVTR